MDTTVRTDVTISVEEDVTRTLATVHVSHCIPHFPSFISLEQMQNITYNPTLKSRLSEHSDSTMSIFCQIYSFFFLSFFFLPVSMKLFKSEHTKELVCL